MKVENVEKALNTDLSISDYEEIDERDDESNCTYSDLPLNLPTN